MQFSIAKCDTSKTYHMAKSKSALIVPDEILMSKIYYFRGYKVMLDERKGD